MNVSIERYLAGFEQTIERLPGILDRWESIEDMLCGEYIDQLEWMLDVREDVLNLAVEQGQGTPVRARMDRINAGLGRLSIRIKEVMGVDVLETLTPELEPAVGIEPTASCLRNRCSTVELYGRK